MEAQQVEIGANGTEQQIVRLNHYLEIYKQRIEITPGVRSLLFSLVCCELEEEQLQKYVDENGTYYTAPSGFDKQRPQWQQLRDNRQRKTAIVSKLEALTPHEPVLADDPLDELRARLV
jgi:hypothetical protein